MKHHIAEGRSAKRTMHKDAAQLQGCKPKVGLCFVVLRKPNGQKMEITAIMQRIYLAVYGTV